MPLDPQDDERLEARIPADATRAAHAAYRAARAAGLVVLVARNGRLIRIEPDGRERFVKTLPRRHTIAKGTKFTLA